MRISSILGLVVLSVSFVLGGCAADSEEPTQSEQQVSGVDLSKGDLHPELPNASVADQRDLAEEARLDAKRAVSPSNEIVDPGVKIVDPK